MQWFNQLSRRDQLVLIIGGFIAAVILLWGLVLHPFAKSVDHYAQNYENEKRNLANVQRLVAEYRQYQTGGDKPGNVTPLNTKITQAINQNQLVFDDRIPSSNGSVTYRFENQPFENLMQFLYDLEVNQGVQVETATLTPSGPGVVLATIRLRDN